MEFMELAKKRFSVRKFSDKKVSKEILEQILEAGMIAPTAKNQQPQRIYVLQEEESLAKLDELTKCRYGAKTVLMFTYNTDEEWKNPLQEDIHSGVEDVSIVATHIMLRAAELDVDTIWVNFFANNKLEEVFGLPANEKSVLIMPVGYKAEDVVPVATHEASRNIEDIVTWL